MWLERLLGWLGVERHDIGRAGSPYLTRWVLLGTRYGPGHKLMLHLFHRGDYDAALHDHPWRFWSLILWGGYFEHSVGGGRTWYGPGRLLRRPAEWLHRVELAPGRRCWTLFWAGDKVRSWGFACAGGWVPWKVFIAREESGFSGCGD